MTDNSRELNDLVISSPSLLTELDVEALEANTLKLSANNAPTELEIESAGIVGSLVLEAVHVSDLTIEVGDTITLNPGQSATVTNSGTNKHVILNFGIPKGATGETGNGISSITLISTVGNIKTYRINFTNGTHFDYQVADGSSKWGAITGTLSDQTDLQEALDSKLSSVPQATSSALGGIKASPRTSTETQEVKIDESTGKLYVAPSSTGSVSFADITGQPTDNTNLATALNAKQDTLVSGTNIKTINNESILTSGNITVPEAASQISYTNPDYPTVAAALDKLLYVTPTVSISGGGSYEIGYSKPSTTLTWSWNKTISSQSLNQGIGSLAVDVRTYTYSSAITSNTTFTITGSDGTTTKSASTTVSFLPKRYWGVSANTTLTDAEILALSQELSTSRTQTRTFDCSGGKYFYFVIRTDYCSGISFKVGGLSFSDINVVTRSVVNAQGYSASYNIYRCNNIQTGSAINVVVS